MRFEWPPAISWKLERRGHAADVGGEPLGDPIPVDPLDLGAFSLANGLPRSTEPAGLPPETVYPATRVPQPEAIGYPGREPAGRSRRRLTAMATSGIQDSYGVPEERTARASTRSLLLSGAGGV